MAILFDPARRVKPARAFGACILPHEPDRPAFRPWESGLRALLASLRYPPCNVNDALSWVAGRRRADGCPSLDPDDVATVNGLVARALADTAADLAADGCLTSHPDQWPDWTDFHHYEPSAEDRAWLAAESDRAESARLDEHLDGRAAESAAVDALTAGLIPRDAAENIARTSIVGHDG